MGCPALVRRCGGMTTVLRSGGGGASASQVGAFLVHLYVNLVSSFGSTGLGATTILSCLARNSW